MKVPERCVGGYRGGRRWGVVGDYDQDVLYNIFKESIKPLKAKKERKGKKRSISIENWIRSG